MAMKSFWVKERHNPQNGVSYTACGQLTVAEAKKKENALYGYNVMHRYKTEAEYRAALVGFGLGG